MDRSVKNFNISRREFISSTAALGAGMFLATGGRFAHAAKNDKINVALLGAGAQGQVLLDSCLRIKGIHFSAVCDIWEQYNLKRAVRLLKKYRHDTKGYVDYKQMLSEQKDLDAVIIATPDFWHARHAIDCMEAGLDVYCEKEMSNKLEDARKMVEVSRKKGKLLQIGHQRRSNPRYIHSYNKLLKEADILGRITTINGQWNRAAKPDLGWPEKYAIDDSVLKKYGYESMHQFRNWRWYKGLGGGPIVDLGSHQIDIYNWFLDSEPVSVMASGGTDYYDKKTHQWYDTVMAIYKYETDKGPVRAYYQTLTTNSSLGYYENFLGDEGTLSISESSGRGNVYPEPSAPKWDKWVKKGYLNEPEDQEAEEEDSAVLDVRETIAPPAYKIPVEMEKKYHQPHLENFFQAVRGNAELNCDAEEAYKTAVTVLKVNEAVEKKKLLNFEAGEFKV